MSWWCSSPAKVASGEVEQQRRSLGHRAVEGGRRVGAGREDAGSQVATLARVQAATPSIRSTRPRELEKDREGIMGNLHMF